MINKILCFLGLHDWIPDTSIDMGMYYCSRCHEVKYG